MKSYFFFFIAQIFFLLSIFIILPTIFLTTQPGPQNTVNQKTLPLDQSYSHTFLSPGGKLSSFSILLKNPQIKSQEAFDIKVYRQEQLVDSITLNGVNVTDPGWLPFKTNPINSQKGDEFTVTITPHQAYNQLYILTDQSDRMNYQTFFSYSFPDSFNNSLTSLQTKLANTNKSFLVIYFSTLLGLNLFFCYNRRRIIS